MCPISYAVTRKVSGHPMQITVSRTGRKVCSKKEKHCLFGWHTLSRVAPCTQCSVRHVCICVNTHTYLRLGYTYMQSNPPTGTGTGGWDVARLWFWCTTWLFTSAIRSSWSSPTTTTATTRSCRAGRRCVCVCVSCQRRPPTRSLARVPHYIQ